MYIHAFTNSEMRNRTAAPCTRLSIHGICALDKLIATHALALGVSLVTNSEADFQGYAGLPIDNWVNRH